MPLRILVVEDHAPFRRLICTALQRRGEVQTIEAVDGLEAVQRAEVLQPDLILLDINLPKLHGFEVAKRIHSLAPHARLLFVSQESSPDIVRKALSLGADGYVQKLSAGTDLLPAIDAVFGGQRFVSSGLAFTEPADAPAPHRHETRPIP
jgi:DNA-binding NarL/FixJ family response regulator